MSIYLEGNDQVIIRYTEQEAQEAEKKGFKRIDIAEYMEKKQKAIAKAEKAVAKKAKDAEEKAAAIAAEMASD